MIIQPQLAYDITSSWKNYYLICMAMIEPHEHVEITPSFIEYYILCKKRGNYNKRGHFVLNKMASFFKLIY
jgi:hypothetical protein